MPLVFEGAAAICVIPRLTGRSSWDDESRGGEESFSMRANRAVCASIIAILSMSGRPAHSAFAQAPPPAPATARQTGTIQAIDATSLTLTTDKGEKVSVGLNGETKVVEVPPGSTDLKAAQPAAMTDVAVGDRVLALGAAPDAAAPLLAKRLVLMKSTDIAKKRAAEQAGWQHGSGGIVSAVDATAGTVTITSGSRTLPITTTPATIVRRYAPGSARFEDATKSTLAELHTGDQLRVRGQRSDDGTIKAEEIVSGSFRHLSGTIQSMNQAAGQVTIKDLKTQKPVMLSITPDTAIHQLPPEVAARFAARAKGAAAGGAAAHPAAAQPTSAAPAGETPAPRSGGGDLSQVVSRLPALTLSDLKVGQAVMVVGGDGSAGSVAAITVLGGVEPILAASPSGGSEMALSPWSMGGGGGEAGGSAQ